MGQHREACIGHGIKLLYNKATSVVQMNGNTESGSEQQLELGKDVF